MSWGTTQSPIYTLSRFSRFILFLAVFYSPALHGQVTFASQPTFGECGTFVADFNGDGIPDVLCASGTLSIGKGDGTFSVGTKILLASTAVAVGDFNGDGKMDVLEQGTGTLVVQLGNGDGTFQSPITTNSGAGTLYPVTAIDLGNGTVDVIGIYNNNLVVFIGKGDATFITPGTGYPVGSSPGPEQITPGDFNNDGRLDVAVSLSGASGSGSEVVLLGKGDGTFSSTQTSSGVYFPNSAVAGDFNEDGNLDLIIAGTDCNPTCSTSLLLGKGDGTFESPTVLVSGVAAANLAASDVNGDGQVDLVSGSDVVRIFLGNGDGTFSDAYDYEAPGIVVAVADFNRDGNPDIAVAGSSLGPLPPSLILLGKGNGQFQGYPALLLPNAPQAAVAGDFDKNGTADLAIVSYNNSTDVGIALNDGTGNLSLAHTYALPMPPLGAIATADLNKDGNLDLVVTTWSPNSGGGYSVLLGNGDGSFQAPKSYPVGINAGNIVIGDFNNDGIPDLAIGGASGNSFALLLGNGDGTFGTPTYVFDGGGGSIAAGDFNGDGKLDMVATGSPSNLAVVLGNGDGTFQPVTFPYPKILITSVTAADLSNDDKLDILASGGVGGGIQVFLGNGDGTFTPLAASGGGTNCGLGAAAIADFNNDGIPDLFEVSSCGGGFKSVVEGVALGAGDGTFGSFIPAYNADEATSVPLLAADMNGDGMPDLVIGAASSAFVVFNTTQPDFALGVAAGSPNSQKVSAGQSAKYNLTASSWGLFSGTVTLSCNVTPAGASSPTCNVPASVNVVSGKPVPFTLSVNTTAAGTGGMTAEVGIPPQWTLLAWGMTVLVSAMMFAARGRRVRAFAMLLSLAAITSIVGCGGGSGSSGGGGGGSGGGGGTPSGTYTITVTGKSGTTTHNMTLTLIVQ